jgi:2-polyprenyl-3-methyl-5-hydroxy-6-metoxy-1,4-benzoquinol methylase
MDTNALNKAIQALYWEANYLKRSKDNASVSTKFLAILPDVDVDFEHFLTERNITKGALLDIGTGTGEQAIYLAQKGFVVTATDISPKAITEARRLAAIHGTEVNFIGDNIISTQLTGPFDIITDRGCYSILPYNDNATYLDAVKKLLAPGGWLLIKADKANKQAITTLKESEHFNIVFSDESAYTNLTGKTVKADFFALQHIDS